MAPSADPASRPVAPSKGAIPRRHFSGTPHLSDLENLTAQIPRSYPLSAEVVHKIPIYDLEQHDVSEDGLCDQLQDEWHHILLSGPGVYILRNFLPDNNLIETINGIFIQIIEDEKATSKGDHFATSGSNSRIWNSYQKHAERHPESFVKYYSNPWLGKVCESWLGPGYQVTAQVNQVHPGGKPQMPHRDYHIGFQSNDSSARFPRAMHVASQHLTLQGAVAHSDMPLESGPTRFLPFSQQFEDGFLAYRLPEFKEYFEKHWVSAPLRKGDAVFFNPVLFHAAGQNDSTNIERSANLLQISSAFGKTMESLNTYVIIERTWDILSAMYQSEGFTPRVSAAIKSIGAGYPFPCNLDLRQPQSSGMAPESEQDLLRRALKSDWDKERTLHEIRQIRSDSLP